MPSSLKRKLVIGVTTVAAAAFAGGAYAATQDSSASPQAFLNDVAKRLHVTPAQLTAAFKGAALDQLNAAVASGQITKAEANALKQRIGKGLPGAVPLPFLGVPAPLAPVVPGPLLAPRLFGPAGPGPPMPFPYGPAGKGPVVAAGGGLLGAAASYLGITPTQLLRELPSGKTLAQLAQAHHKSVTGLKSALLNSVKARLDKLVSAKVLSAAQEQAMLSGLSAKLDALIHRSMSGFLPPFAGRGMKWRLGSNAGPAGPVPVLPARPVWPAA